MPLRISCRVLVKKLSPVPPRSTDHGATGPAHGAAPDGDTPRPAPTAVPQRSRPQPSPQPSACSAAPVCTYA
eukprot:6987155-Prymnesium_polylepis.1